MWVPDHSRSLREHCRRPRASRQQCMPAGLGHGVCIPHTSCMCAQLDCKVTRGRESDCNFSRVGKTGGPLHKSSRHRALGKISGEFRKSSRRRALGKIGGPLHKSSRRRAVGSKAVSFKKLSHRRAVGTIGDEFRKIITPQCCRIKCGSTSP